MQRLLGNVQQKLRHKLYAFDVFQCLHPVPCLQCLNRLLVGNASLWIVQSLIGNRKSQYDDMHRFI